MGRGPSGYGLYKSGSTVCFGDISDFEVFLVSMVHDKDRPLDSYKHHVTAGTNFATFEEAVKEIGALNRTYQVDRKRYYEDYDIMLYRDDLTAIADMPRVSKSNVPFSVTDPDRSSDLSRVLAEREGSSHSGRGIPFHKGEQINT